MVNLEPKPAKRRNRGHNKRIGFTEEFLTRDVAEGLLSQEQNIIKSDAKTFRSKLEQEELMNRETNIVTKKSKKRKQTDSKDEIENNNTLTGSEPGKKKEKKKKIVAESIQDENQIKTDISKGENNNETVDVKSDKSLSKRAIKRLHHQQLLDSRKRKSEIDSQNKALNYLSNWKYNRSEWKFEKLKQVWLVQHLYDPSKIDDSHWETLVEYLNNSQGKVRDKILDEAVKIVEDDEIELNNKDKFKRAKDIVQSLQ